MWSWVGPMNSAPDSVITPPPMSWPRTRPPTRPRASRTTTDLPAATSPRAVLRPARPAPTTATSELLVRDPFALLIGFALDQQVSVQKAFVGPLVLRERVGTLDAAELARMDLDPVFRERPAIHRFPGNMAKRVQALAAHVAERYDG